LLKQRELLLPPLLLLVLLLLLALLLTLQAGQPAQAKPCPMLRTAVRSQLCRFAPFAARYKTT
jgi:hypothetical protein